VRINRSVFLVLSVVVLTACNGWMSQQEPSVPQSEIPLTDFVIGGWKGEDRVAKDKAVFSEVFGIEFVDAHKMIFNAKSVDGEFYNEEYDYEFVSKDDIVIRSKRVNTEWRIYRSKDDLEILFPGRSMSVTFKRFPIIDWLAVAIGLSLGEAGILLLILRRHGPQDFQRTERESMKAISARRQNIYGFLLDAISSCLFFAVGSFLAFMFMLPPIYLLLREPWYSIIQVELGIIITTLGIGILRNWAEPERRPPLRMRSVTFYTALLVIGFGFIEILIGVLRLASRSMGAI